VWDLDYPQDHRRLFPSQPSSKREEKHKWAGIPQLPPASCYFQTALKKIHGMAGISFNVPNQFSSRKIIKVLEIKEFGKTFTLGRRVLIVSDFYSFESCMKLGRQIYRKNTGQYNTVWDILSLNTVMSGEQIMIKIVAKTTQESFKAQTNLPTEVPRGVCIAHAGLDPAFRQTWAQTPSTNESGHQALGIYNV